MSIEGISTSQIDSMLTLLRNTAAQAAPPSANPLNSGVGVVSNRGTGSTVDKVASVSFADMLKNSLNQTNKIQSEARQIADKFTLGDDQVSLSDVMIAGQKASISLQTTVQVRNKLVSAYTDIMNMQI